MLVPGRGGILRSAERREMPRPRGGGKKDGHPLRGFPPSLNSRFPLIPTPAAGTLRVPISQRERSEKNHLIHQPYGWFPFPASGGRLWTGAETLKPSPMGKGDRGEAVVDEVIYSKHSQQEVGMRSIPSLSGKNKGEEEVARGRNPRLGVPSFCHPRRCRRPPRRGRRKNRWFFSPSFVHILSPGDIDKQRPAI